MEILFLLFSPEAIFLGARENFPRLATRKRIDYNKTNVTQDIPHSRERATFRRFIIVVRL